MIHSLPRLFVSIVFLFLAGCSDTTDNSKTPAVEKIGIHVGVFTSPQGRTFWLVQDHKTPRIVLSASFRGGHALEGDADTGKHIVYADTVTKGAGSWTEKEWSEKLNETGASFSVSVDEDRVKIQAVMLEKYWKDSLPYMEAVIQKPRFDEGAIQTTRNQLLSLRRQLQHDPDFMISEAIYQKLLTHPYVRHPLRNIQGMMSLKRDDLIQLHKAVLSRPLTITIVGNISPKDAGHMIDKIFPHTIPVSTSTVPPLVWNKKIDLITPVPAKVSQATIVALHNGIEAGNPDNVGLAIVMRILDRRIFEDVREERGLAYTIYANRSSFLHGGYIECRGGTSAREVKNVIALVSKQWQQMADKGPTEKELQDSIDFAVNYLTMLPDSVAIAQRLDTIQFQGKSPDYIHTVLDDFRKVSLEKAKIIAGKYLKPDNLRFFVHGINNSEKLSG